MNQTDTNIWQDPNATTVPLNGGTFTITLYLTSGNITTGSVNYNDSLVTLQAALDAVAGAGNTLAALISGSDCSNGFTVEYTGTNANTNFATPMGVTTTGATCVAVPVAVSNPFTQVGASDIAATPATFSLTPVFDSFDIPPDGNGVWSFDGVPNIPASSSTSDMTWTTNDNNAPSSGLTMAWTNTTTGSGQSAPAYDMSQLTYDLGSGDVPWGGTYTPAFTDGAAAVTGQDPIATMTVDLNASGGTFDVLLNGSVLLTTAYNTDGSDIQAALQSPFNGATVTNTSPGVFVIDFGAHVVFSVLTINSSALTQAATSTVTTTTPGAAVGWGGIFGSDIFQAFEGDTMIYRPGDTFGAEFTTFVPGTGPQNADTTPVATATRNGNDDVAFALTVTNLDTGRYWISGTVPAYSIGDRVSISVATTMNSVPGKLVVSSFAVDSKFTSDLQDIPAGAAMALTSNERNSVADAYLDRSDAVDGRTPRQTMQEVGAVLCGKVSGVGSGTEVFLGFDGVTTRVTVTVDSFGNRTSVVYA